MPGTFRECKLSFCNPGGSLVLYMLCIHHLGCFLAQHSSFSNALAVPSHNRHQYIVAIYHHTLCIIDIYRYVWWSRLTWYVCTYMYGAYTRNTHFETCGIRVYREPSFQYLVVGACICACAYAVRACVCVLCWYESRGFTFNVKLKLKSCIFILHLKHLKIQFERMSIRSYLSCMILILELIVWMMELLYYNIHHWTSVSNSVYLNVWGGLSQTIWPKWNFNLQHFVQST